MTDTAIIQKPKQGATGEQLVAANPAHSAWVGANAGTGKTRVLIDRITRLLLDGAEPGRILCLTFTKAAAAEMADRLSERLGLWATLDDAALTQELAALLENTDGVDLNAARRLFARCLEFPGGLKIQTIHAFAEKLLKRFPLEADIQPHFAVIEERTAAETLLDARDQMLAAAFSGTRPDLEEALVTMTALVDEEGFSSITGELIGKRSKLNQLLRHHGGLAGLIAALHAKLDIPEDLTEEDLFNQVCQDAFYKSHLFSAADALAKGSPTEQARATVLLAWLNDEDGRVANLDPYFSIFLKGKNKDEPKVESNLMTKKTREQCPLGFDAMLREQDRLLALKNKLKAIRTLAATKALLTLGGELLSLYEATKARKVLVDYDDLILKTKNLLSQNGGVSWVLFKLDGGLDHILVDEAQDTSPEQWDIVRILADEFFADDEGRKANRTLFVVGDEKQSIYSFQGADPEGFGRMRDYFAAKAKEVGQKLQPVDLTQSYRSTQSVLGLVDAVFSNPAAVKGLSSSEGKILHNAARLGEAGLVELWPNVVAEETPKEKPWDAPLDQKTADSPEAKVAARIADTIKGWLESNEILPSKGRPIRPDDIMILVRERKRFMETMVRALKVRGIPVAGTDRMVLTDQLAIQDLMALAAFVLLPDDDLNTATILKSPLIGLDEEALFDIAYGRGKGITVWQSLRQKAKSNPAYGDAVRFLEGLLARADFTPPYEFFAAILSENQGRKKIVARLGTEVNDPIDEFLSLALSYEREHKPSLQGFLHWLQVGSATIKRDLEQGEGDVRVMTVHGSKGLQGNIVFLPDTCAKPSSNKRERLRWDVDSDTPAVIWSGGIENEEETAATLKEANAERLDSEYRRLLYVALTRASDRLYITGWGEPPEGCWYDLIKKAMTEGSVKDRVETFPLDDEEGLRLANPQEKEVGQQKEEGKTTTSAALPDWAMKTAPKDPLPPDPLVPSRPDEEEPAAASPFTTDKGDAFKRGRLIHRLLQSLPDMAPDKRTDAAKRYLAQDSHGLDKAEQKTIADETLAVMNNPDFANLFGPGSMAEVPIIGTLGIQVISAQVDRLVVREDDVMIVDYKTNRPPPVALDKVAPAYLRQMAAYRAALQAIYPNKAIRCLLLWTDAPRLMELDSNILAPFMP